MLSTGTGPGTVDTWQAFLPLVAWLALALAVARSSDDVCGLHPQHALQQQGLSRKDSSAIAVRTGRYLRHGPISLPISRLCNGRALKRRGRYRTRSPPLSRQG